MSAPAIDRALRPAPACPPRDDALVLGTLLGRRVVLVADAPPPGSVRRLLAQLDEQWDLRRRSSELSRLTNRPHVMVAVTAPTRQLVRAALAAVLGSAEGAEAARSTLVDERHGRVGVDPLVAAAAARLVPATAADLLARLCEATAAVGFVQVGGVVRPLVPLVR